MNKILITTIDMHTFNSPLLQLVIIANKRYLEEEKQI